MRVENAAKMIHRSRATNSHILVNARHTVTGFASILSSTSSDRSHHLPPGSTDRTDSIHLRSLSNAPAASFLPPLAPSNGSGCSCATAPLIAEDCGGEGRARRGAPRRGEEEPPMRRLARGRGRGGRAAAARGREAEGGSRRRQGGGCVWERRRGTVMAVQMAWRNERERWESAKRGRRFWCFGGERERERERLATIRWLLRGRRKANGSGPVRSNLRPGNRIGRIDFQFLGLKIGSASFETVDQTESLIRFGPIRLQ